MVHLIFAHLNYLNKILYIVLSILKVLFHCNVQQYFNQVLCKLLLTILLLTTYYVYYDYYYIWPETFKLNRFKGQIIQKNYCTLKHIWAVSVGMDRVYTI